MAKNPRPDEENNNGVQQDDAPDLVLNNDGNYELAGNGTNDDNGATVADEDGSSRWDDVLNNNENDDVEVQRYDQLIAALPQTESLEEKEARAKREKRDRLFSAIGDGVSALSNLYFTTKGAPSQGEGVKSMSDATGEYYDRQNRNAEKRDNAILNKRLNYEKARAERIRVLTDQKMKVERLQNEVEKLRQQAYLAEKKGDVYEAQRLRLEADTRYKDLQSEGQRLKNLWYPSIQQSGIRQKDQGNRYNKPRATPIPRDDGQGGRPQQTPTQPAQPRTTPQQQVPQQAPQQAPAQPQSSPAQPQSQPQTTPQQTPQQQSNAVNYLNSIL